MWNASKVGLVQLIILRIFYAAGSLLAISWASKSAGTVILRTG